MENNHNLNTLTRAEAGVVAGVCAGIADYYGLRKNGLRIAFLLTSLLFGFPIIAYIILWLILPKYPSSQAMAGQLSRKAAHRRGT